MSIPVEPHIFHDIIRPDRDFEDVDDIMKWDEYMRKPSTPITDVQAEMDSFLWEWLEFLTEEAGNCLGLAAMQIGLPVRAFYLHLPDQEPRRFRNPEIVKLSKGKRIFKGEGCMSYPGRFVDTERHMWVTVKDDINGEKTYTGLEAICIQHEMDHLDGKLCFDYEKHGTYIRGGAKIGRNDPCPCGSGKKYKKCCGE